MLSAMTQPTATDRTLSVVANVRAEAARRGYAHRDIAKHLGISGPSFSARMTGKTPIDVTELFAIADLLQIDAAQLLESA